MFLKRAKLASSFYSFLSSRAYSVKRPHDVMPIDVTLKDDIISLTFDLTGERPINFFVSNSFTFQTLKETIQAQYPNSDFEYDFSGCQKLGVSEESNIMEFLTSKDKGEVVMSINQDDFALKNSMAENLSQIVLPFIENTKNDPHCATYWFSKCLENKMQLSHAGTLAYFLRSLSGEIERFQGKGKLSEKEIDDIISKAMVFGREPTQKRLEECYHELNIVNSQIHQLEKEKLSIEEKSERRINLYLKLILLATLVQFVSFYYMIFHVEWLGWDIIEPITYTVQCLTVIFGIRFYMKYGLGRDLQVMKELNRNKIINKDKIMKARYQLVTQQLAHKISQRDLLAMQRDLYLNRRNYYQFFFSPAQSLDVRETA